MDLHTWKFRGPALSNGTSIERSAQLEMSFHCCGEPPTDLQTYNRHIFVNSSAPAMIEATDVFLIPGSDALYSCSGRRIVESCIRRGASRNRFIKAGEDCIAIPDDAISLTKPVVYLSHLQNHWGHFLTEGISRLWCYSEYAELKDIVGVYCTSGALHKNIRDFLNRLPFSIHVSEGRRSKAIKFAHAFIPDASFTNQCCAHKLHVSWPRRLARMSTYNKSRSTQPVYLARTGITCGRTIRGEAELVQLLQTRGFLIVYPEQLTLEEQVRLYNAHSDFYGCWGSAFHSTLFCVEPGALTTHVFCDGTPNLNYLLFDSLVGNESNYVRALERSPDSQPWPNLDLSVQFEIVQKYCLY